MASFFSHGFASGGSSKKGKKKREEKEKEKEEEVVWVPVVDGCGNRNWQHRVTGAYWTHYVPAPMHHHHPHPNMVPAGYPVVQAVPLPPQHHVYPLANNAWAANVVPVSPVDAKKQKEWEKGGHWDSIRDERGVRCYKHSRTNKIRYDDPLV